MRLNHTIPDRTRIWIGRSALQSLSAIGTHIGIFTPEIPARTPGMVVNIVVGHLAIQVMTFATLSRDPRDLFLGAINVRRHWLGGKASGSPPSKAAL
jgi:hypothetical protein